MLRDSLNLRGELRLKLEDPKHTVTMLVLIAFGIGLWVEIIWGAVVLFS